MEQLLWTFDQVKPFARHPDAPLRVWALERLTQLFPERAGPVVVTMLADPGRSIADRALDFLAETGQADQYGPVLLEHLQQAEGDRFGRLALALARLDYRPALPLLLDYLQHRGLEVIKLSGYSPMAQALGRFGGDEMRQAIWDMLDRESLPDMALIPLLEALLQAARPEDLPRLVEYWRAWPDNKGRGGLFSLRRDPLEALAEGVDAGRLLGEMRATLKQGLRAMLDRTAWWLNADISLSRACLEELERVLRKKKYAGAPALLRREADRLAAEQGDDLAGWQATWDSGVRPVGYRRRALYAWLFLDALAQPPARALSRSRQEEESLLGLALLVQWSAGQDDQARLETAADRTETLLDILTEPRQQVWPDIVEQVVALGPDIAPLLIDRLDPDDWSWTPIRIIQTLTRLARLYPGSAKAAVPKLIQAINEEQGDFIKEAAADALTAIGPPAVEPINRQLRTTRDESRQIYLTGILGHIPVAGAAEVILANIKAGRPIGEIELIALSDIGSAAAIEPLYRLWEPGDAVLAEHLLTLCELNGVTKPELAEWRRLVAAEDERIARIMADETFFENIDPVAELQKLETVEQPLLRSWPPQPKQPPVLAGRRPESARRCPRDGFPLLEIDGQWVCVAEYLDRCIGWQPIVDVIQTGQTVYYVFENGHQLPLLCSCCGRNLEPDVEQERGDKIGRRLEGMSIGQTELEDGQEIEELVLEFSKKSWFSAQVGIPVAFEVAAQLRHPATCPHRARRRVAAAARPPKRKKRRGRKRAGRN